MNRTKFSVLLLLAAFVTSFSAKAEFHFGPKLGVNVNQVSFDSKVFDSSNRCGFTGGVTLEYIAPVLNLGADISVMYTHMKSNVGASAGNVDLDIKTVSGNFIEIPLHVKYKIANPISSIIKPYVFTGPSVALKLGGENDFIETKKAQWGWDLGLGVELIKHLQIGAGYTFGINKVVDHINAAGNLNISTDDNVKARKNYWTITAAWMF